MLDLDLLIGQLGSYGVNIKKNIIVCLGGSAITAFFCLAIVGFPVFPLDKLLVAPKETKFRLLVFILKPLSSLFDLVNELPLAGLVIFGVLRMLASKA